MKSQALRIFLLIATLGSFLGDATGFAGALPPSDLPDLVEKVLPGVVNISSTTVITRPMYGFNDFMDFWGIPKQYKEKQTALGTGFLIDKDGYILTNNHVVEDATEVMVTLLDKREFRAKIIGKDQKMDLALLQIRDADKKVPQNLSPVPTGNSDQARIAETVFAVGNPFGLQHTVTIGIISAKNRTIGQGPFDNFLQTDASINPGNSGGPLFNLKGEVIGINTVIFSRTGQSGGLGFAIPVNEAKRILPDLKRYGRVPRPWLGILGQPMNVQIDRYYGLGASKGVLISDLAEGGPADQAGLRSGDVIVQVSGEAVTDLNDVERHLVKLKPTETVSIQVVRKRRKIDVRVHLEELPRMEKLSPGVI